MTLGNAIITNKTHEGFAAKPDLVRHELDHTVQSAVLRSDVYATVWLNGLAASLITGNYSVAGGVRLNPLELLAASGGGCEDCFLKRKS